MQNAWSNNSKLNLIAHIGLLVIDDKIILRLNIGGIRFEVDQGLSL